MYNLIKIIIYEKVKFMEVQIMITLKIDRYHIVSSSEIVRNFSKMLDKTKESLIFITRNNNIEEYEMLLGKTKFQKEQLKNAYIKEIIEKNKI
jgi:hypothetical protein